MLECYKKNNGALVICEYLIKNLDTGFVYGIGQYDSPNGPENVMLPFSPQDREIREILAQIRDYYIACPLNEVFTYENFWMLPPTIIALLKTQKHA